MSYTRKRKRAKQLATILSPVAISDFTFRDDGEEHLAYIWPGLEVHKSVQNDKAGDGVFAVDKIKAGLKIPVMGDNITQTDLEELEKKHEDTHVRLRHRAEGDVIAIDGRPSIMPYNGVGGNGMYIAMMINEPARGKPNCIFKGDFVQVAMDIAAGKELTISYGPGGPNGYRRIGYKVSKFCERKCEYRKLAKFR
jgi:hypothetical protein